MSSRRAALVSSSALYSVLPLGRKIYSFVEYLYG
jgi:hypothetical protein